MITICFLCVY